MINAENVTIWVKWAPNLASFAAAFCALRTHARQGPNLGTSTTLASSHTRGQLGTLYREPVLDSDDPPLRFPPSLLPLHVLVQQRPHGSDLY
jgi:hypothetical protein